MKKLLGKCPICGKNGKLPGDKKAQAEVKVKSSQPEDTEPLYQPSQFTPLDIPATTGDLNIVCERG